MKSSVLARKFYFESVMNFIVGSKMKSTMHGLKWKNLDELDCHAMVLGRVRIVC